MSRFLDGVAERLAMLFDPGALGAASADLFANLIVGLVTFLAYYAVWRLVDVSARLVTRRMEVDRTSGDSSSPFSSSCS